MATARHVQDWLSWLIRVRILVISFVLAIELVIRQFSSPAVPIRYFLSLILLWYTISVFYAILSGLGLESALQAVVQIMVDLLLITALVYVTGSLDSYLVLLYPLVIIVASILFSRRSAFLVSAASFLLFSAMVEAAYARVIPPLHSYSVGLWALQVYLGTNLAAFLGVWYLASRLAESWRKTRVELQDKAGELEELQAFSENILQCMRSGLLTTDLHGRILLLNPAAEEILEVGFQQVRGTVLARPFAALAALLPSSHAEAVGEARREVGVETARGTTKTLGVSLSPLRSREGKPAGYVFNFQDLTQVKRLEQEVSQKEKMATLGRMAAAMAHEIRNPLAAIGGSVRQLARYALVGEAERKLVEIVNRESERLNRVVNDILTYSREKVPNRESVNLVPLVEETLLLLERHPRIDGSVRVERQFPRGGLQARVDVGQFKQVLWNLCDNALRAMPNGGTLRVRLEQDGPQVRIRVADTGVGLQREQQEKIFEPFEGSFAGGTGLGLAIVYQIVQGHGGRVSVQSGESVGTEFTVELPMS